jgi:wyosine [tRNA(Phe)-imidazoG37] synthetase (radical SAM superfamily)
MEMVFGPVPSRRLGRSLGVNNIPPKVCSYACVYCQLGRAIKVQRTRQAFYAPDEVEAAVEEQLGRLEEEERIDYLCFVPDGEPTLDAKLGESIRRVRRFGLPVALISNGSLMDEPQVREALLQLDWISLKADAAREEVWRRIDRPFKEIDFAQMHEGYRRFARQYSGILTTETMLIDGLNTAAEELESLASFLQELEPDISYLAVPTRPPAEHWAEPADEETVAFAYRQFARQLPQVELLIGYEGNAFSYTGDARNDLLSITAVHPMREEAVTELLRRDGAGGEVLDELLEEGSLLRAEFHGLVYYVRKFRDKQLG